MYRSIWLATVAFTLGSAAEAQTAACPDAAATDPVALGWMVAAPPPPDGRILIDDGSAGEFPKTRWSFSHLRELMPTVLVPRGEGAVRSLQRALRADLNAVTFVPPGGTAPMTWGQSFAADYTDGIVVLHKGRRP